MSLIRVSGTPNVQQFLKTASTALDAGGLVTLASGQLIKAVTNVPNILGICKETIASTDADYATVRPVSVDMIDGDDVIQADVTGTLTAAMVGDYFNIADDLHVTTTSQAAQTAGATGTTNLFLCIGFISASVGLFMLASPAAIQPSNPTS